MLVGIIISEDGMVAEIITSTISYTLYHSEGRVIELVEEMVTNVIDMVQRSDEITQVTFVKEVAA